MRRTHGSEGAPVRQRTGATRLGDENGAATRPMPVTSSSRATVAAKGAIISSILVSSSAMSASIASIRASILASRNAWCSVKWPVNASSSALILPRIRVRASCGQRLGVAFPGDQRGHHRPAGLAEDVAGHHRQLDAGVLQQLFHPVLLRCPRADQVGAVAGDITQPADRRRRHEAGPDHLPLGDLAQPDAIELVRFRPARQVLHVLGVDQPGLEPMRLQHVKRRPPVVRRCLHHHPGHSQAGQPVGQAPAANRSSWNTPALPAAAGPACPRAGPARSTSARPCRCPAPRPAR